MSSAQHAEHIVALTGTGHHHLEARIATRKPSSLTYAGLAAAKHNHTCDSAPIFQVGSREGALEMEHQLVAEGIGSVPKATTRPQPRQSPRP